MLGDIKDLDVCIKACEGVDYVLNQAAWGSVPRSVEMPLFYCANNIQGTLNMLEAARRKNVKKLCMHHHHQSTVMNLFYPKKRDEKAIFCHLMR